MEIFSRAGQASDDNKAHAHWFWIPTATNTHNQAVQYSLPFHDNNGCTNAPRCYVIRTFPVLFIIRFMMKVLVHIM